MLGRRSRILVLAAIVATAVLGAFVHHLQNSAGVIGGRISIAKLAWLLYTVFVWGMLCPILAAERSLAGPLRCLCGLFAALMWARFAAETPMLYLWKNWRPPYGMAHDLVCAIALGVGLVVTRGRGWRPRRRADRWMLAHILVLILGALVECLYAGLFYQAVRGATTGDQAVWFAAPGDPRFDFINRLTAIMNVMLYSFLAAFLVAGFRAHPEPVAERSV